MTKVTCYPCQECDQLFLSVREAYECCGDWLGIDGWACDNSKCGIYHREEEEAKTCGAPEGCACGHLPRHHAVANGWQGCYELDCRCPKYERMAVTA